MTAIPPDFWIPDADPPPSGPNWAFIISGLVMLILIGWPLLKLFL